MLLSCPYLGHERGFSASAIGAVLGAFAASVALIRLAIPGLAHRLRESTVLVGAMLWTAAVFVVYPLVHTAWLMTVCAVLLGSGPRFCATDDHEHLAPDHATPSPRRGHCAALHDHQHVERRDAVVLRAGRCCDRRRDLVLGDGRRLDHQQPAGAPDWRWSRRRFCQNLMPPGVGTAAGAGGSGSVRAAWRCGGAARVASRRSVSGVAAGYW